VVKKPLSQSKMIHLYFQLWSKACVTIMKSLPCDLPMPLKN